jgi:hypothetical protein
MRRTLIVGVVVLSGACRHESVTAPTVPVSLPAPVAPAPLPAFGLVGDVHDTAGRLLAQARVEVLDGPQKGAVAVTNDAGAYVFEAIFTSRFTLRASKEGYRDQSLVISSAQSGRFFALESVNGSPDLRGSYEITFTADAACRDLPSPARTRTYSALFESAGSSRYVVTLRGADFARGSSSSYSGWNVLYVGVFEDFASIWFSDPPVWEHLTPDSDLLIVGEARGTIRAGTSQWAFAGNIAYCAAAERGEESYLECKVPEIICRSQDHRFTLARQ